MYKYIRKGVVRFVISGSCDRIWIDEGLMKKHMSARIRYRRARCFLLLALAVAAFALVLASCNARSAYDLLDRQDPARSNIHNFCDLCHKESGAIADSDICLWCHLYQENHHPNDFTPPESELLRVKDSGFPLFDGKVRCLSCHDPHGGDDLTETPKLLRDGPYPDPRDHCSKCHYLDEYVQINVHRMIEGREFRVVQGKVICNFCHKDVPNSYMDKTNDVTFRADTAFVCWRCHWTMPGPLLTQHLFKKPSPELLSRMKAYERENEKILPLVPRGKISCSTCHNPHQLEVMKNEPARAGAGSSKLLRIRKEDLCFACHQK
jgi:hypothetical protein